MDFCQAFGLPVFVISIGVQSLSVRKLITDDFLGIAPAAVELGKEALPTLSR
jgi:hypothetical protein